jgi:hypothetical protein
LLVGLLVFGFAPGALLRLIVLAFRRDDPRRRELLAELHTVPRIERPFWVLEQLEVAVFEGIWRRIIEAATGRVISLQLSSSDVAPSRLRRVLAWLSVPVAPVVALAAIFGAAWVGFSLIAVHDVASAVRELAAVSFLLALALFGLSLLAERQAARVEYVLAEWLRRWENEFVTALPERRRSFRACIEDPIRVGPLQVRTCLEDARERPSLLIRHACTATAAWLQVSAISHVGWEAYLEHGEPSAITSVIALASVALFWTAWWDLRNGRSRHPSRPLAATAWPRWNPAGGTTNVPTAPVILLYVLPVATCELVWATQSAWTLRAASVVAVVGVWSIAWRYRAAANGPAIVRCERVLAPFSSALARSLLPLWWTVRVCYVITGITALAGLGILAAAPAAHEVTVRPLGEIGVSFLAMHIMCGVVLWLYPRPTGVRLVPAKRLLNDHAGPGVERRIEVMLAVMWVIGCIGVLAALVLA